MIFLLRHGEINSDAEKRFIGWTDISLNAKGLHQARQWQRFFSNTTFENVYCSDLIRARRTAEIIGGDRKQCIQETPSLREIRLGEFENLARRDVQERFPEKWRARGENMLSYRPDGGESFNDLCDRVLPFFEQILSRAKADTLIVAHAGVNRVMLCHVLGIPLENMFRIGQDYACLNRIDFRKRPYRVDLMNYQLSDDA
jgi:alpha-ribazole phosphatase